MGVNVNEIKEEFRNFATETYTDFKDKLVEAVSEIVKVELKKITGGTSSGENGKLKTLKKPSTYADIIKGSNTENVVIEPINKQDSDMTFIEVKKKVKIGKLGVGVDKLKKTQAGKIVVGCSDRKDREKLASELKKNMGQNYNIRVTDKKLPKVKIIDVDSDTLQQNEECEIIEMIKKQNGIITNKSTKMTIRKKMMGKNKNGIIIMEVDPDTHKLIIEKIKIKLDWNLCRVFDCVSVLRCYKCWGFNHFAQDCKSEPKCRKCSGNYLEKDCHESVKRCVNCVKMVMDYKLDGITTDHCANDLECECYKRALNRAQKTIDYKY